MKRPGTSRLVLIISVLILLLGGGVIVFSAQQSRNEAEIDSVGSRDLASVAALESTTAALSTPSPVPSAVAATPSPSTSPSQRPMSLPVGVRIPSIGVDAKVLPMGLDEVGAMALPEDITKVAWYELGVPPGADRGSAVLAAHRDGRVQGHGVFYDLGRLDVGNRIAVTTADGGTILYEVVARELIAKQRLPLEELFAVDGPARLTLISCGGYYDRSNGGYQDNVVVTAIPVR